MKNETTGLLVRGIRIVMIWEEELRGTFHIKESY